MCACVLRDGSWVQGIEKALYRKVLERLLISQNLFFSVSTYKVLKIKQHISIKVLKIKQHISIDILCTRIALQGLF